MSEQTMTGLVLTKEAVIENLKAMIWGGNGSFERFTAEERDTLSRATEILENPFFNTDILDKVKDQTSRMLSIAKDIENDTDNIDEVIDTSIIREIEDMKVKINGLETQIIRDRFGMVEIINKHDVIECMDNRIKELKEIQNDL